MSDVVVVGAGITGLSLALFLTRAGADVRVVDRAGIAAGASGVQPGGVRQQWSTDVNCVLARESVEFYARLDDELGIETGARLDRCGYLFVALTQGRLDALRADVALQHGHGIPSRIVTADEASELVPGLAVDAIAGAAWCGEDGYFDRPQTVVEAFARAAGVEVEIAEVEAVEPGVVLTSRGPMHATSVVLAAGVDTTRFVDLPIEAEERHLFLSDPVRERLLEPLVIAGERSFAAKQLANGRVLASDLAAAGDAERNRETWRATVARGIDAFLPVLAYLSFPVLASGVYDVTPDHQPVVGPVDDGLWVAAGYSGHGFMLAPAISRRLADAVLGDGAAPIPEFAPDRLHETGERAVI